MQPRLKQPWHTPASTAFPAVPREGWRLANDDGGVGGLGGALRLVLQEEFQQALARLSAMGCAVYVTIDADVVCSADVPGVSAPNPLGLPGRAVAQCARLAGRSPAVSSLDLVEISPRHDRDNQSARWAALVIWSFLAGLSFRNRQKT